MNKGRRKQLTDISGNLEDLKCDLELLRDEEQEYYDKMPESMQGGEKGSKAEEAVEAMDTAISEIEDVISNIENAQQ